MKINVLYILSTYSKISFFFLLSLSTLIEIGHSYSFK